jgi:hypothetical protein
VPGDASGDQIGFVEWVKTTTDRPRASTACHKMRGADMLHVPAFRPRGRARRTRRRRRHARSGQARSICIDGRRAVTDTSECSGGNVIQIIVHAQHGRASMPQGVLDSRLSRVPTGCVVPVVRFTGSSSNSPRSHARRFAAHRRTPTNPSLMHSASSTSRTPVESRVGEGCGCGGTM